MKRIGDLLVPFGRRAFHEGAFKVFGKSRAFGFGDLSLVFQVRLVSDNHHDGFLLEGHQSSVEVEDFVEALSVRDGIHE